ncbi:MAG: hypothetical protein ACUVYA_05265, partial [Planctomycetota bacterium]
MRSRDRRRLAFGPLLLGATVAGAIVLLGSAAAAGEARSGKAQPAPAVAEGEDDADALLERLLEEKRAEESEPTEEAEEAEPTEEAEEAEP